MATRIPGRRWFLLASAVVSMAVSVAFLLGTAPVAEAQSADDVRQFTRECGRCHSNPYDEGDQGPDIHNKNISVTKMTDTIRNGTKRMRPIPPTKLSDAQLEQVMNFLRTIHAVQ